MTFEQTENGLSTKKPDKQTKQNKQTKTSLNKTKQKNPRKIFNGVVIMAQ